MTPELQQLVEAGAAECGAAAMRMPSGAGHDAMVLGHHLPSAMLFIPSIGGRSHDVTENSDDEDIILGCEVLAAVVERLETFAGR
jgi:N-carbamoyl-L-amino-acid hydrolase